MPRRLPPLSSLRFFEAAGRHQSFKLAAAELNMTPSAISHGIAGLEKALGVALFVRSPRTLSLTTAGADYLAYISEAFSLIAIGTQRLPDDSARATIALSCAPTLASRWLLPRLHRFLARYPEMNVTVDTSSRHVGFPADGFDFAIRMSRAPVAGTAWVKLFGEQLLPSCSPAYRANLTVSGDRIDFRRATLIHVNTASEDWDAWLQRAGIEGVDTSGGLRFDTLELAFDAAITGLGVVLGRRPLVDQDLISGALVPAYPEALAAETAYWLVSSDRVDHRPELSEFKRWLIGEIETTD